MKTTLIAIAAIAAASLAGCTTTNGVATLTPTTQADVATVLSDAQNALAAGDLVIGLAEATGELTGTTATNLNLVLDDLQTALTAAQAADTAANATTVAAKIAAAQAALTDIQTAAPQDASLIASVKTMLSAFAAVEATLPAS